MRDPTDDPDAVVRRPAIGPGRRKRTPGPIVEAYADAGIERRCTNCGAAANTFCRHPSGAFRKIPCPNR
ncbi:hypothetical protein BH11ACT6_BH11ACT6_34680 [soil metagenome]